jgi:hypothetical protein
MHQAMHGVDEYEDDSEPLHHALHFICRSFVYMYGAGSKINREIYSM